MKTLFTKFIYATASAALFLSCSNAGNEQENAAVEQEYLIELWKATEQYDKLVNTLTEQGKDEICRGLMSLKKDSLYSIKDGNEIYGLTVTDSLIVLLWASGLLGETCEYAKYARTIYEQSLITEPPSENDEPSLDGLPCKPPTLSKDTLFFGKQGGGESLTTTNNSSYFRINSCGFKLNEGEQEWDESKYTRTEYQVFGTYGGIDTVKNDYCKDNYCEGIKNVVYTDPLSSVPIMKAECSWFSLTKTGDNSLLVQVSENETFKERERVIVLESHPSCVFNLTIIQSAE